VAEEMDLFLRLAYVTEVDYVAEPLARWRVHAGSWSHARYELFADERALIIEKLRRSIPGFDEEYADELRLMRRDVDLQRAEAAMKAGRGAECRSWLKAHLLESRTALGLYAMTFFPAGVYRSARSRARDWSAWLT